MSSTLTSTSPGKSRYDPLITPLFTVLVQLQQVLSRISDAQFTGNPNAAYPGSIGAHVRHTLDHVQALITATHTGSLCYDHRQRGTSIETNRSAALHQLDQLGQKWLALRSLDLSRTYELQVRLTPDAVPLTMPTSFEREAAFILSHTIHHNAILSLMLRSMGVQLPDGFGYAPSTLQYLRQNSCVPSR